MTEVLDRIASHLVGLRMPRALEALDHTVQQIEKGELSTLEAIDCLLAEELSVRESRRLGVAAVKAGKDVYRCTLAELIETLSRAEREGRLVEKIHFYSRASVLIIPYPAGHAKHG